MLWSEMTLRSTFVHVRVPNGVRRCGTCGTHMNTQSNLNILLLLR